MGRSVIVSAMRALPVIVALVVLALAGWVIAGILAIAGPEPIAQGPPPVAGAEDARASKAVDERAPAPARVPSAAALRRAADYAAGRDGTVSFAVVNSEGGLRGRAIDRLYPAASTVKAMLLIAEAERLERAGLAVDAETSSLLDAMITVSDNEAADAVYARVGDPGMFGVARRAGMTGFTEAGSWGNAQVSAADLATFFAELDRLAEGPHREYALGLLGSVAPEQSWGIPQVARPHWAVRFKGGWLPERGLVHQAAELRDGDRRLAIAVLTDAQPSFEYGIETIRATAGLLLSRPGGA